MTLYSCRHDGDQYRISKFDDDMNVQSSYLCTVEECNCPAGVRPMCRHREMLPRFIARDTVGSDWFFDFDRGGWVQVELWPEPITNGPHSAAASTADFDSADGGSNPPVAANKTATEIANTPLPELRDPLVEYLVDRTLELAKAAMRPLPAQHYPSWRRI